MDGIVIEKARLFDAGYLLELQKLAFQSEAEIHRDFHIQPLLETIADIRQDFLTHKYYKALLGTIIAGSVRCRRTDENVLLIGRLIVHPDHQNKGIGKKLMNFIENEYKNVRAYELFTAERSIRNTTFYSKLGYEVVDKFPEPSNNRITLVRFVKSNPS